MDEAPNSSSEGLAPEIRRRCERYARPLYAGLDGVDGFDRVARVLARLEALAEDAAATDRALVELMALFHGVVGRLGSLAAGGRFDLFLRGLGLAEAERARVRRGLERFEKRPRTAEEMLLHDAALLEESGVTAAVDRLLAAGKRKIPAARAVETLDAGPPAERFRTAGGAELGRLELEATREWIEDLRSRFRGPEAGGVPQLTGTRPAKPSS